MSLFKYLGVAGAIGFLENQSVRFTQPKAYNDPFEMSPVFYSNGPISKGSNLKFGLTIEGYNPELESFLVNHRSDYKYALEHNLLDQINGTLGVTCFTFSEGTIPANLLMWAHYAESHRGIAVQFKDGVLGDNCLNKVHYVKERPFLDANLLIKNTELHVSDLFFKSDHWDYEQEYRLVRGLDFCTKLDVKDNADYDIYLSNIDVETIERIFVGVNAPKELESLAESFHQKHGVTVVFQQLAERRFSIVPRLILTKNEADVHKFGEEYESVKMTVFTRG